MSDQPDYLPRHRAISQPVDAVPTLAKCDRSAHIAWPVKPCPRHNPGVYADQHGRHATDSFGHRDGKTPWDQR